MSASSFALLLFCIVTEMARELCFKRGVDSDEAKEHDTGFVRMVLTTPMLWLGISFWVVEMIAWIIVLGQVKLNIAFPIMSVVYCGVPIASRWLLGESMNRRQWLGAGMITFGVAMVGWSGV